MNLETRCLSASSKPSATHYKSRHIYYRSHSWVTFLNNQLPKSPEPNGWKFHISIEHAYLNDIWPIIEPILLSPDAGILGFKVFDITQDRPDLKGKQIVLYTFNHVLDAEMQTPDKIFSFLVKLESTLRYHKIPAGITPEISKKIPGSRYISMRHDMNLTTGEYLLKEEALAINKTHAYNPFEYPNPYEHFAFFNLNHNKQRFFTQKRSLNACIKWIGHEAVVNSSDLQHFSLALKQLFLKTTAHAFTRKHFEIHLEILLFQYPEVTEIILSPQITDIYLKPEYLFIFVRTLQHYPNIHRLNLSDYNDKPIGEDVITAIKQNTYLTHIDLSNNYTLEPNHPKYPESSPSSVMEAPWALTDFQELSI
jgi:hypothetical protein